MSLWKIQRMMCLPNKSNKKGKDISSSRDRCQSALGVSGIALWACVIALRGRHHCPTLHCVSLDRLLLPRLPSFFSCFFSCFFFLSERGENRGRVGSGVGGRGVRGAEQGVMLHVISSYINRLEDFVMRVHTVKWMRCRNRENILILYDSLSE